MRRKLACWLALGAATVFSQNLQAESWRALAGAESPDHAIQVIAFLPNEMWIHAGDSITWAFPTPEPHSATFLTPGLMRPAFTVGCPGTNTTPDPSSFDNSSCVNSGRITTVGITYTVTFPKPGNYRLVCLVHVNMTGTIHVLDASLPLPHDQAFYDEQGVRQARALLTDHDATPHRVSEDARGESGEAVLPAHHHMVIAATGEVVSTSGGINSVTVMRFMQPSITINAGETVEWDSLDVSGHTITFGTEPPNVTPQTPPSTNVFADADGARHAIIYSASENVHSGLIVQARVDRSIFKEGRKVVWSCYGSQGTCKEGVAGCQEYVNPWKIPTFDLNGPLCFYMAKEHVIFGLMRGAILRDPEKLLEGTGKYLRHIKLGRAADVRRPAVRVLVKQAAQLNRKQAVTGTKVQMKRSSATEMR